MIEELPLTEGPPVAPATGDTVASVAAVTPGTPRSVLSWLIEDVLLPCYRAIIPLLNVWQWADGRVFLDERATSQPGHYDSAKTPWTREFMETFTSTEFDEDHVMKSSRVGITEAALNVVRYMPENRPGAALVAIDTTDEAKKIATDRLIPTLPNVALTDDEDDVTRKLIRLRNMVVHIAGSYSPTIFRNKWLLFAFLDEIEVVEEIVEEGTLHDLARSRQHDVPGAKLFTGSKPKKWRSKHHCEVVTGTLSAYLVECPHCHTFQELSFDGQSPTFQLRIEDSLRPGETPLSPPLGFFDEARGVFNTPPAPRLGRFRFDHCKDLLGQWDLARIEAETFYECVSGCAVSNGELKASIRSGSGRWIRTNPRGVPRKRSRHIWDAYSLHEKLTLGFLAREFVLAQSDPAKLLHFVNNHLGMPWRERRAAIGDAHLLQCREAYARGTTPFVPDIVLIGVDSQYDHWKFVTAAYKLNRERAVINWGRAGTPVELLDEFNRPIPLASDPAQSFNINRGFVDAAGAEGTTDRVYALCRGSFTQATGRQLLWPVFGRDYSTTTKVIWDSEITHEFRPIRIYFFADEIFKRRLYLGSILRVAEIKAAVASGYEPEGKGLPPRLQIPGAPADAHLREFMDELQSEQIGADGKWRKLRGLPNDFGDGLKLCDVMFDLVRPWLLAEKQREKDAANEGASSKAP